MLRGVQLFVSGMAFAGLTFAGASIVAAQEPAPAPAPAQPAEPAAPVLTLDGDAAIITILIKPDKTADFELVLNKLKESLQKAEKPERKEQAAGWKVFKSTQAGPNGAAVYIFLIDPVVKGQEYDISRLINEVFPTEVQEIFAKYKDAFAGRAISNLSNFLLMSQ